MPPTLPERYRLNVRLGRDGDIEEWLATDEQLDRPVLVRYLVPEAGDDRRLEFLEIVRSAAGANHAHLQRVYAAGDHDGVFSVSEWDGAVSVADRLRVGETLPVDEFLPNAAGIAAGLAAFHINGGVHGSIDESTIHFSAAHPAKLGGWGRPRRGTTAREDTAALAVTLRTSITGSTSESIQPSHVAEGMSPDVDTALDEAAAGSLDAAGLADALLAAPYRPPDRQERSYHWKWTLAFAGIAVAIVLVAGIGLAIDVDPDSPFLFPATPSAEPSTSTTLGDPVVEDESDGFGLRSTTAVFDPLGDGNENDEFLGALLDGAPSTSWSTEPYPEPIGNIKAGVGVVFEVEGEPRRMQLSGSPGTRFRIGWAEQPGDLEAFEDIGSGTLLAAPTAMQLPNRPDGVWLLWLVDLPLNRDGAYRAEIAGVRFVP